MSTIQAAVDLSPVQLSYIAALRGVKPAKPTEAFSYAQIGAVDAQALTCLAACNPQGRFYGVLPDAAQAEDQARAAEMNKVANVTFLSSVDALPSDLGVLCCFMGEAVPAAGAWQSLATAAKSRLAAGGTLAVRYRAYALPEDSLKFLVREYAPELSGASALEFLDELRALGAGYFETRGAEREALDAARAAKNASPFLARFEGKEAGILSGTFAAMETFLPAGFSFVGDAEASANYLELAAPPESHEVLSRCREHLLYEPIKDFVLERTVRTDVWVKAPVEQTLDAAELFGHFTFGITAPREHVPTTVYTRGGSMNLQTPLYNRLIETMCTLPMSIGDFLSHPAGFGMEASDVVAAVQVLVGAGIAQPMRTHYEGRKTAMGGGRPAWATPYNAQLFHTTIGEGHVRLASAIVGGPISLPVRDALVLQAIHRVGLADAPSALAPELKALIDKNPALAAQVTESADPSEEVVKHIVTDVVTRGLVRWYAYGLLAA